MYVKDQFVSLGKFQLSDGLQIRLWEDKWLENQPLKLQFPFLFNIVWRK